MVDTISILLVDDESRNLDALETILHDSAYRLLRAGDADRALHLLLENDVAAIVLDIKMPGVSGVELAKLIKGTRKFRQIPIVFLTAHLVDDEDVLAGYGVGAVDYLTKPVNPKILRHKVAVFADLFRKTRALADLNESLEMQVRQRTAELERSEQALRIASAQKDHFLATLSHELRNPLAPLRTGLALLLRQTESVPVAARTLAVMDRQLDHMVRLIDDLLDVSRISGGTIEIRKENVDLGSLVERAIETTAPSVERLGQSVSFESEGPVTAHVDPTRVVQILSNLLDNASKYSPSSARIRVELRREGEAPVVRVIDEGAGIPSDQLSRVFEMFTKIERLGQRGAGGLGIGLALARQLAELHDGTLSVTSAGDGKGSTFTLTLPPQPTAVAGGGVAPARPPHPSALPRLKILVVEDNEDAANTMFEWLNHLGHEVRIARTGPEGVALALDAPPDVVLCDIGLPGMDGVDVCHQIVAAVPMPPVMVALTGWGSERDRQRTVEAGFRHHLVKPVAVDKLRDVLEGCQPVARSAI